MIKVLVNRPSLYISVGTFIQQRKYRSFIPDYEYDRVGGGRDWQELTLYWYKWFIHFNNKGKTGE